MDLMGVLCECVCVCGFCVCLSIKDISNRPQRASGVLPSVLFRSMCTTRRWKDIIKLQRKSHELHNWTKCVWQPHTSPQTLSSRSRLASLRIDVIHKLQTKFWSCQLFANLPPYNFQCQQSIKQPALSNVISLLSVNDWKMTLTPSGASLSPLSSACLGGIPRA